MYRNLQYKYMKNLVRNQSLPSYSSKVCKCRARNRHLLFKGRSTHEGQPGSNNGFDVLEYEAGNDG